MGKNDKIRKLNLDEETKKLLREYQLPEENYLEISHGNDTFAAIYIDKHLECYIEKIRVKDHLYIDVRTRGLDNGNAPFERRLRYDVTNGTENAKLIVEELDIFEGFERLTFKRRAAGGEGFDGLRGDNDFAAVYYITTENGNWSNLLSIVLEDGYQNSDIYQSMYVGIPSEYVYPTNQFVRPVHTIYRIGKKDQMLNIALNSRLEYVFNGKEPFIINGIAFEKFDEGLYRKLSPGMVAHIFENENLSQARSTLLYSNSDNALKVLKKDTGIELAYGVVDSHGRVTFEDNFSLPCQSPCEITEDEIDSIIASLLNRYHDEIFIDAVVIELEKFKKEMGYRSDDYPEMMTGLATMNLHNFNFDNILKNKDNLFSSAREQYADMYSNNSLIAKGEQY